jgi:hypothetical protein
VHRPRARAALALIFAALTPAPAIAQTPDAAVVGDAAAAPSHEALRAAARAREALSLDEAAWVRARLFRAVARATGTLLAPTALDERDGVATWTLVADVAVDPSRLAGACEAAVQEERRVACAADVVTWAGAERARVTFAWRAPAGRAPITLAQPLRALSRFGEGLCLAHAERTPRTLDLTVRARDAEAVGRALAVLTVVPGLSDVILVREELRGDSVEAVLSWPLGRAQGAADLAGDAWPTRCDGRSTVGAEARPGTAPVARERVRGTASQGAVVRVGRREWLVTAGDVAAGTTVVGVREAGVMLRPARARRAVLVRFPR